METKHQEFFRSLRELLGKHNVVCYVGQRSHMCFGFRNSYGIIYCIPGFLDSGTELALDTNGDSHSISSEMETEVMDNPLYRAKGKATDVNEG